MEKQTCQPSVVVFLYHLVKYFSLHLPVPIVAPILKHMIHCRHLLLHQPLLKKKCWTGKFLMIINGFIQISIVWHTMNNTFGRKLVTRHKNSNMILILKIMIFKVPGTCCLDWQATKHQTFKEGYFDSHICSYGKCCFKS